MIPGIGRAAWAGGATGGGTGRTTSWESWDGTADTAWQTLVDETSSNVAATYEPTFNEKNANRLSNDRAIFTINDGSGNVSAAVFRADTLDATAGHIELYGTTALNNRAGLQPLDPNYYMVTSTVDVGSVLPIRYNNGTDDITTGGKLDNLATLGGYQSGWISNASISNALHSTWYLNDLFTDEKLNADCMATGPDFGSAACQLCFTTPGAVKRLFAFGCQDTDGNSEQWFQQIFELPDDLDDLITTPSSAITQTEKGNANHNLQHYNGNGWIFDNTGWDMYSRPLVWKSYPEFDPQDTSDPWSHVYKTSLLIGSFNWVRNESLDGGGQRGPTAIAWKGQYWKDGVNRADEYFGSTFPYSTPNNTYSANAQQAEYLQYKSDTHTSTAQFNRDFLSAIQDGPYLFGFYSDETGESLSTSGQMYVTSARFAAQETDDQTNDSNTDSIHTRLQTYDNWIHPLRTRSINDGSTVTSYVDGNDDIHVDTALQIATTAGVDGSTLSSNAIDHGYPMMLQGQKFAYVYRQGTQLYWSIFSYTIPADTTQQPQITREVDGASLGTVPEANISGFTLGTGVAVIVVGNKYKIVKVPA